ncbi:hypothetical protein K502DRAFT_345767 [Neoconidiobolus thromboides FSU 785]|nr:hypothetical protein K502DRAFT_345767 [Neoconidiobolus thromboides FSU 785]
MMGNSFRLECLEISMIKDVLYHLTDKDKINLLLCCRVWNKIILPILWEDIVSDHHHRYNEEMRKAFEKYGHYIKHLDFIKFPKLPIHPLMYPNSRKLFLPLENYLKHIEHFKNIPLIGLSYTNFADDMTIEKYISANKICIKKIFQDLRHIIVLTPNKYFTKSIVPCLPSTVTSLLVGFHTYDKSSCLNFLLDNFNNLRSLRLVSLHIKLSDFNLLLNREFPQLNHLHIEFIYIDASNGLSINLYNYPKLKTLYYRENFTLIFSGVSHLKKLTLNDTNLSKTIVNNEVFPKLNQLTLGFCDSISSKCLYSIFDMSTITYLDLTIENYLIFLVKEIYPKKNNIITLKVRGLTLGKDFIDFLYMLCLNLQNLEIVNCCFDISIPFSNHKMIKDTNLQNVTFKYIVCPNLKKFIDHILIYFKNIKSLNCISLKDTNFYAEYKTEPDFL